MPDQRALSYFYDRLTPRKREVLRLVCQGLKNTEIAAQLFITTSVVAGHLTEIYEELTNLTDSDARANRYTVLLWFGRYFDDPDRLV